ncbi:hypothetical protein WJX73_003911 [Symbiochloris irregularis]|uniref:Uncharacterized protein n=1 Tax=Symbiochloris irregularis TaxID=706552 RepID=A0AAW1P3E9_9CHLO
MANSYEPYLLEVKRALSSALCLYDLPCEHVERYSRPEVEFDDSPGLMLPPIAICRNEREKCLIERSVNSVRFSIQVKQDNALEVLVLRLPSMLVNTKSLHLDAHEASDKA